MHECFRYGTVLHVEQVSRRAPQGSNSCHRQREACGSTWLITYRSRWAGSATGQLNYSSKQRQQSEIKADKQYSVICGTGRRVSEHVRVCVCVQG